MRRNVEKGFLRGHSRQDKKKCLPDGLSEVDKMNFVSRVETVYLSQTLGRAHANNQLEDVGGQSRLLDGEPAFPTHHCRCALSPQ